MKVENKQEMWKGIVVLREYLSYMVLGMTSSKRYYKEKGSEKISNSEIEMCLIYQRSNHHITNATFKFTFLYYCLLIYLKLLIGLLKNLRVCDIWVSTKLEKTHRCYDPFHPLFSRRQKVAHNLVLHSSLLYTS